MERGRPALAVGSATVLGTVLATVFATVFASQAPGGRAGVFGLKDTARTDQVRR